MTLPHKINLSTALFIVASLSAYSIAFDSNTNNDEILLVTLLSVAAIVYFFVFRPLKKSLYRSSAVLSKFPVQGGKNEIERLAEVVSGQMTDIQQATAFVQNIKSGNLATELQNDAQTSTELITSLVGLRDQMLSIAAADQERQWVNEGMAKFVEILRRNNNEKAEQFYDQILSNIVKYLNANQGALFVVNEKEDNEKYLSLAVCYAYNRKKFLQKEIPVGQGLIGQAYMEKSTIFLKQVPDNYVAITSGLGAATPRCLLIVPFKLNESVECIMELASFTEFKPYQIQFLEKLGESIASTIFNLKINENTKRLLLESQQTTEEMKAQEEELKQNMEELEATQEEMRRKEAEMVRLLKKMEESEKQLKEKLEEIRVMKERDEERSEEMIRTVEAHRKTLVQLLDQLPQKIFLKDESGKFVLCNTALADAHHKTVDQLIGTSDFDFFSFDQATIYRNKELEIIAAGKPVHFEEVFKDPKGPEKILQTIKMPFYITYLNQVGLLGIQTDVTDIKMAEKRLKELQHS